MALGGCNREGLDMNRMKLKWISIYIVLGLTAVASCSIRAVYYDQEQALAQMGVDQLHDCYNRKDYEALYSLMSENALHGQSKDAILTAMQATVEKWGREESSSMVFAKVYPGAPIQVRMIYNTTYEKGQAQEWFIWKTDGNRASLLQYQIFPGWADPNAIKAEASK